MKQLCCGDVVPGCRTRFSGEDERDILAQVTAHAREAHGMGDMGPELLERVRSATT